MPSALFRGKGSRDMAEAVADLLASRRPAGTVAVYGADMLRARGYTALQGLVGAYSGPGPVGLFWTDGGGVFAEFDYEFPGPGEDGPRLGPRDAAEVIEWGC